jgi:hypothetical protein
VYVRVWYVSVHNFTFIAPVFCRYRLQPDSKRKYSHSHYLVISTSTKMLLLQSIITDLNVNAAIFSPTSQVRARCDVIKVCR